MSSGSVLEQPWILGVGYSHNGAACLLRGDDIHVMVQEERLTGVKRARIQHHQDSLAVRYCLSHAGLSIEDVDMLAVCHFSGPSAPPVDQPDRSAPLPKRYGTLTHHLGHAYAVLATSGFDDAAVLVIDGQGGTAAHLPPEERINLRRGGVPGQVRETEVASIYRVAGDGLTLVEKHTGEFLPTWSPDAPPAPGPRSLHAFGSLGGLYSAVADLVFHDPLEAGKVMGLAPYGRPTLPVDDFFTIDEDGRFHFVDRLRARFRDLEPWPHNEQAFADLAASAQAALERAVVFLAERARRLTGASRLCYAGGVALNGVANELVHTRLGFDDVYVMPAAEDSGTAIGAAYHGLHALTGRLARRRLDGDRRGRSYPLAEIETALVVTPHVEPVACADVLDAVVDRLCAGEIVGWFQGGSELGPRALGQRSILCDARRPDAKALLNERVKRREGFRPFAPAILLDQVRDWFDVPAGFRDSPSMLRVCRFVDGRAEAVPGAAHIDGTGRLQTVTEENGRFYHLLARFHLRTGVPLLVNTSFNIAGEPIVETPEDALWCLLATQIDAVAIEDRLVRRAEAHRSILQLRPRLRAHRLRVDLPITDGSLRLKIPADAGVSIVTSTPYGELSHRIRASDTLLLGLCDGTRDGWQILAALRGRQGYVPEELVARRLCFYRRAHVIALGAD